MMPGVSSLTSASGGRGGGIIPSPHAALTRRHTSHCASHTPQIQRIVARLPPHRQTLFFSATWPKEVKNIAAQFVRNHPVHVFVGGVEEKLVANKSITQVRAGARGVRA